MNQTQSGRQKAPQVENSHIYNKLEQDLCSSVAQLKDLMFDYKCSTLSTTEPL